MKWTLNMKKAYKPTPKELEENRRYIEECERLGIVTGLFTSGKEQIHAQDILYTIEELKAMQYLTKNAPLPPKLEIYLLSTKDERMARHNIGPSVSLEFTAEMERELAEIIN